nr:spore coat protein U domain-containing protein [Methylomarinum sp. Ch1-1]MDP4519681.1 spore coat protein U domain-containing protein [Methylomarinum sp. Ch1-1]
MNNLFLGYLINRMMKSGLVYPLLYWENTMKSYTQMTLSGFDKKALLSALLAAGMVMGSTGVSALTATGDMTVSATLTSACSVSASTLDFGSIAALNVTADVTGDTGSTLEIACTTGTTTPVIYSTSTRTMTDGGLGSLAFFLAKRLGLLLMTCPIPLLAKL